MSAYRLPRILADLGDAFTRAQTGYASALARLGTNQRHQTAIQDPESYILANDLRKRIAEQEAVLVDLSRAEAFVQVADAWVGAVIDNLSLLKAETSISPTSEKTSQLREVVKGIASETYRGRGLNSATTHDTVNLPSGSSFSLSFTASNLVDTAALGSTTEIQTQIDHAQSFAEKLAGYGARVQSHSSAGKSAVAGRRLAVDRITSIDLASELAAYAENEIRMHAAAAMMSQASLSAQAVMLLYR